MVDTEKSESSLVNVAGGYELRCHKRVHQSRLVSRTVNFKTGAQLHMTLTKYVGILASGLALTGAASAQGNNDAMSEMAQIKAELATLKAQNGDNWLTAERADVIKTLVKDVLADSETRTSLQGSGATSGYNNGFFISSADGNFKLQMNVLEQVRWTLNNQPGGNISSTAEASNQWGFENRRTEMTFSGNVVDPSWTYMVRTNYGSSIDPYTATPDVIVLQDAWAAKDFGNGFGLKVGQFKSPFMAESLRNDGAQLSAERSVVDYYFSGGYVQGLALSYSSDQFRATGSYNNGPRGANGGWGATGTESISVAGRAEFKASGSWGQFDSESSAKSDESGLLIGAALQYYNNRNATNQFTSSPASAVYADSRTGIDWTVDATYKSGGMSLSAAFVGAQTTTAQTSTKSDDYGMVVQGGYHFTDSLEAFGRWEWVNVAHAANNVGSPPNSNDATDVNNILTFGVNAYVSTNIKWTTQVGMSLSDMGTAGFSGAGWRADNNTAASDQFNIISQLQVSF
ncbi:MAG: hypothetical protein EXS01_07120 [Phycisphaerales bacterium]|nr:hypothetical protein [Phycisphaerales bacterium]